jgi:hypothetical protein
VKLESAAAGTRIGRSELAEGAWMLAGVWRCWRAIGVRRLMYTTGIALVLETAGWLTILPFILGLGSGPGGENASGGILGLAVGLGYAVCGAYCYLFALTVAELGVAVPQRTWRRYAIAVMAATVPAVAVQMLAWAWFPIMIGLSGPLAPSVLAAKALWSAATWVLTGGLVVAVYARFQAARYAREAFNKAELERAAANREVLASRLAAMQAQVEPQFLLGTLAQVEALYERDPASGVRMLDGLIAYLRAALPQLRSEGSTLAQEARLAESYLGIVKLRKGDGLELAVDIPAELGNCAFPPMLLLPLIDDALRAGFATAQSEVGIAVRARAEGERVHVVVARNGPASSESSDLLATLRERLGGLYGERASLTIASDAPRVTLIEIELPHETASADR